MGRLAELRQKLASPRTRHRERAKVAEAVEAILRERDAGAGSRSRSRSGPRRRIASSGAAGRASQTLYVKSERTRFELTCRVERPGWPRRRGATGSSR